MSEVVSVRRDGGALEMAGATHRLDPLLSPRSIALVGASPRKGSVGNQTALALLQSGFAGTLDFINPRHASVEDKACVGDLKDLGQPPDLVILNVGAHRLESALHDAISIGAGSAVIFDICQGVTEQGQPLLERLRDMAREADFPICGGNGMGFFNVPHRCHASFYSASHLKPGGISLIAHSGSVFTVLALNDPRYRFDLAISPGQEIGATIDEYVDYAARRPSTKVIALFMEAARNPQAFARALQTAHENDTPVVVCKVGRSEQGALLAKSHSGAMAGNGAAYDAVLERYGAIPVSSIDELMNAAMLLGQGRAMTDGEAAMVTDSGGLRELFIDRAEARAIPLAQLSEKTAAGLNKFLPHGLPASNPLDCAGIMSDDFASVFERALHTIGAAHEVGMVGYEVDARDDHTYNDELLAVAKRLPQITGKPCFAYSCFSQAHNRSIGDALADAGLPQLNGLDETLSAIAAVRALREVKQHVSFDDPPPQAPDAAVIEKWSGMLAGGGWQGEATGLRLLSDFSVPATQTVQCTGKQDVCTAAEDFDYPVVLKTAEEGIAHKSDVGGVVTGIAGPADLEGAYRKMSGLLGPNVIIQEMAAPGIELAFGYVRDPDFGPLVMLAAGGTLIEILGDRQFALAPFGVRQAERMVRRLKLFPLLTGARGAPACDIDALALAIARFSVMCAVLGEHFTEMDVNPVIVNQTGVLAVDALL